MIHIIDNKKIDLTTAEWEMYQAICEAYNRDNYKGADLFRDLFETNDEGIIIIVKPPSRQFSTMEVYLYLVSIMTNQHLRNCHEQVDSLCREAKDNIETIVSELKVKLDQVDELINKLTNSKVETDQK